MDLSTTYMGMRLKHPIVAAASPLSKELEGIQRLEDAGAAAIVMYSLFEEQIIQQSEQLDHHLSYGTESFGEALDYLPDLDQYHLGPNAYLELIQQAKNAVDIPIIGSLNAYSAGGWIDYAYNIEQAGADGLELNIYYIPTDPMMSSAEVEKRYVDLVMDVRQSVSIPVAVKLSPYFSATAYMARLLADAGTNALVLFNRFYQPDIDLENLEVRPHLVLSNSHELRLPLCWIGILYGRIPIDLAITSGVHTYEDVLKSLMAGANITMVASEFLQKGIHRIGEILEDMTRWMEEHEYESVSQMIGSMSQLKVARPDIYERANYMKELQSFNMNI